MILLIDKHRTLHPKQGMLSMVIVGTKADKLKPVEVEANAQIIKDALLETWEEVPPFIISSSETKQSHKEIWDVIKNAMKNG